MTAATELVRDVEGERTPRSPWPVVAAGATTAGILSGLRMYFAYGVYGAPISLADSLASGLMDWWLWVPFVPLILRLAERFHPSHARPGGVLALHAATAALVSFGQLLLFSALSGVVRAVRFGDAFRVDVASPVATMLAPGVLAYAAIVALGWWRASPPAGDPAISDRDPVVTFRAGRDRVLLRASEITWIGAAGNYLEVHTGSATHLVRETMKSAHGRLGSGFLRVHRSTLVQRAAILRVSGAGDDATLSLRDGTRLPVGRRYRANLEEFVP